MTRALSSFLGIRHSVVGCRVQRPKKRPRLRFGRWAIRIFAVLPKTANLRAKDGIGRRRRLASQAALHAERVQMQRRTSPRADRSPGPPNRLRCRRRRRKTRDPRSLGRPRLTRFGRGRQRSEISPQTLPILLKIGRVASIPAVRVFRWVARLPQTSRPSVQTPTSQPFPIGKARRELADLFTPTPWIYWADFLVSMTIGYAAAHVYLTSPMFSWPQIVAYFVAGIFLYRLGSFMHEIVHFRRGQMTAFKVVWNVLAGVPLLVPSFLYESHLSHHNTRHYGTGNDGEYLPLGVGPVRALGIFLAQIFLLPLIVAFRFLVLSPISFLHPRLRQWVLERASSNVINFGYRREIPDSAPRGYWAAIDILCFLRMALMVTAPLLGLTDWSRIPMIYALAVMTLGMNHFRTLAAHRYTSQGLPMSHLDQLGDSVNIEGDPVITEALCPLGLRYHALHHVFPSMPYHNLAAAHRRLVQMLPENNIYRLITYPNLRSALRDLIAGCREAEAHPPAPAEIWYERRAETVASGERASTHPDAQPDTPQDTPQGTPQAHPKSPYAGVPVSPRPHRPQADSRDSAFTKENA